MSRRIIVERKDKTYTYQVEEGTWTDSDGESVPKMLHSSLEDVAIGAGIDPHIFGRESKVEPSYSFKKGKYTTNFNPLIGG